MLELRRCHAGGWHTAPLRAHVCSLPMLWTASRGCMVPLLSFLTAIHAMQVPLMVACTAPFLSALRVQIGYTLDKQVVNQNLALPVIAAKFCTPPDSSVPREVFFQRWRTLQGGQHPT